MLSTALPETGEKPPPKTRFSPGDAPRNDVDAAVAPLLARANLLKLRRQWEEAVAVCAEAIRRSPDSASAHSLLGDIYLAQGKNGDALHWYRMALDRNPNHVGLAEKHNNLLVSQRAVATGGFASTALGNTNRTLTTTHSRLTDERTARFPVKSLPTLTPKAPGRVTGGFTVERTLDWFDRVFPQGRASGMPRIFFIVTGILSAVVIVTGAFLFFALRKSDVPDEQNAVLAEVRPVNSIPTMTMPPTPTGPALLPATPTTISPSAPPPTSLFEALSLLSGSDLTITAAQADPERSQAQLEIALPMRPGETTTETRNRILQASAKASQAAFGNYPSLQRFSVRALLRGREATGSLDAVNANLVFVGETSGVALRTLSTTSPVPDYSLLSALFTNTWWAENLNTRMP